MKILSNDDIINCNPFEVTDSDVDVENTETNIRDESYGKNDFTDIEQRCNIPVLSTKNFN